MHYQISLCDNLADAFELSLYIDESLEEYFWNQYLNLYVTLGTLNTDSDMPAKLPVE